MKIEDHHNMINILYGYHPERIDEQVFFTMLYQSPYLIRSVTQKQAAINAIHNNNIDIALISNHLTFIDPYDFCEQVVKTHTIPVFMFVSSPDNIDIPKAFAKGASDIIFSPYIKPLIFARIENYCRLNKLEKLWQRNSLPKKMQKEPETTSPNGHKHYRFKDTRILLAEDNEVNQQLMKNILIQSGMHVEIVHNGQAAVENIRDVLEKNEPLYDLILMDLQMPIMDGFSASMAIRELVDNYQKHEIPIIAITAYTSANSREKCSRFGMVDFMPKPIDPETCLEILSQWIHSDKISHKQTNCVSFEKKVSNNCSIQVPEINPKIGIKRAAGNETLFKKMLLEFFNEYQHLVEHLKKLSQKENLDDLLIMAHTLKGLGGNIGAENLQKNAFLLEQAIKQNIQTDIHDSLTNLIQTITRLINGISQNMEYLQDSASQKISTNNDINLKQLKKSFQHLDELLEKGRAISIDAYYALASQIPESMKKESKHLESLIIAYNFDNAQECLHHMTDML
jgi:CheY-like chemotaxis protein/HPt (histidine-containing phosphotransfer) domain-containing protein